MTKKKNPSIPADNVLPDLVEGRQLDPEVYNSIAKCAKLLGIQLIESNFTISPRFFDDEDQGRLGMEVTEVHGKFDGESRVSTCIFEFDNSERKGRKRVFSIKSKFVVFYHIAAECDEYHAVSFARRVGVMACYPYFRSHVAHTASLANAELPILPTLAKMPVKQREAKKEAAG